MKKAKVTPIKIIYCYQCIGHCSEETRGLSGKHKINAGIELAITGLQKTVLLRVVKIL